MVMQFVPIKKSCRVNESFSGTEKEELGTVHPHKATLKVKPGVTPKFFKPT
jgi:hypothetical protein